MTVDYAEFCDEALIEIGDRVMVDYVLAALTLHSINRIVVAGPDELRTRGQLVAWSSPP